MKIFIFVFIFIFSIIVFLKTFLYGLYEIKSRKNWIPGIIIIIIAFICLIGVNMVIKIR